MHIVILAEFAVASGGAEKVAVESAHGLARAGIDITYIQAIDGAVDPLLDHPNIRHITLGNADIWSRPPMDAALSGLWNWQSAARLRSILRSLPRPADVIHLHQWTRSLSPSVFPVLFDSGVPVAVTLHDYFLSCPNGVYYRFDQDRPCGLKPLSKSCVVAPCDPRSRFHKAIRVGRSVVQSRALRRRHLDLVHVCDASLRRADDLKGSFSVTHHRVDNPVRVERGSTGQPGCGGSHCLCRSPDARKRRGPRRRGGTRCRHAGPLHRNWTIRGGTERAAACGNAGMAISRRGMDHPCSTCACRGRAVPVVRDGTSHRLRGFGDRASCHRVRPLRCRRKSRQRRHRLCSRTGADNPRGGFPKSRRDDSGDARAFRSR